MLLHVPVVAVRVRPRVALPLTVGADDRQRDRPRPDRDRSAARGRALPGRGRGRHQGDVVADIVGAQRVLRAGADRSVVAPPLVGDVRGRERPPVRAGAQRLAGERVAADARRGDVAQRQAADDFAERADRRGRPAIGSGRDAHADPATDVGGRQCVRGARSDVLAARRTPHPGVAQAHARGVPVPGIGGERRQLSRRSGRRGRGGRVDRRCEHALGRGGGRAHAPVDVGRGDLDAHVPADVRRLERVGRAGRDVRTVALPDVRVVGARRGPVAGRGRQRAAQLRRAADASAGRCCAAVPIRPPRSPRSPRSPSRRGSCR